MLALPIRLGGLGIFDPCKSAQGNYEFSVFVTSPLALAILNQLSSSDCSILHQQHILKQEALSLQCQIFLTAFHLFFQPYLLVYLKLAGEKVASSWLSTLPLECHAGADPGGVFGVSRPPFR